MCHYSWASEKPFFKSAEFWHFATVGVHRCGVAKLWKVGYGVRKLCAGGSGRHKHPPAYKWVCMCILPLFASVAWHYWPIC